MTSAVALCRTHRISCHRAVAGRRVGAIGHADVLGPEAIFDVEGARHRVDGGNATATAAIAGTHEQRHRNHKSAGTQHENPLLAVCQWAYLLRKPPRHA